MSRFKEQLEKDIDNVFMNLEEFADWHHITVEGDGVDMIAIVAEDSLEGRDQAVETLSRLAMINGIELPIYNDCVTIIVKSRDFGPRLRIGAEILLDRERKLTIEQFKDAVGLYVIVGKEVL